ncbi:MAG: SpoIIE family protein phosphatase [Bacteroidales bacterium]|nr:MAG: SpoIIE family protein phosphatase [Bacteroidales bacterium]
MNKSFVFPLLLGFITPLLLFPQVNNYKVYSVEEGLPKSTVLSLAQDSRGYLWLGTQGSGACRFDGFAFSIYDKDDGLANNEIRKILEDSRGNLWFGTFGGLSYYNGYHFKTICDTTGLLGNQVLSLLEDSENHIWAGTDQGLNRIEVFGMNDSVRVKTYSYREGLNAYLIFDIYEDRYNRLWLATFTEGIYIVSFDNEEILDVIHLFGGIIPGDNITSIEEDNEGNLWFGTWGTGTFRLEGFTESDPGSITVYNTSGGLADDIVWDIMRDTKERLWFATDKSGILRLDETGFKEYSDKEGFPDNQVFCLLEDMEKNIWAGTINKGLARLIGDHFSHFTEEEGLPADLVFDIEQDSNGDFWLATRGSGLVKMTYTGNKLDFKTYTTEDGLPDNYLNSLSFDRNGNLWIGTMEHGISVFNGEVFTSYTTDDGLTNNQINFILADKQGIVWCGTKYGISRFDGTGFFAITGDNFEILPHNDIQTIIEDGDGNIWIGTYDGLVRFRESQMQTFDEVEGLNHKQVYALSEDGQGNIWIGTYGGGLYRYDASTSEEKPIHEIARDTLLSSNDILSLVFQDDRTLLVGTNKGFDKLTLDTDLNIVNVKSYNKSNGFFGIENNMNSIYRDRDGCIWFGTVKGLTRYDPSVEKINPRPPVIHLGELSLSYMNIDWSSEADSISPWFFLPIDLKLPYHKNHLTFKLSGISLSNPDAVRYKYRLDPQDKEWSPAWQLPIQTFSGISPGDYTFMAIAMSEEGIWNEESFEFRFTIKPPFYQTFWFITLMVLIIIIGIIAYIKYRERKLIREKHILEQKVEERTVEIRRQKSEIEQKNRFLEEANEEITLQKEIIEKKNIDITDSIRYAKRIQEAVLPSEKILQDFMVDSFILNLPKDIVSGDFYWIKQKDGSLIIVAADCTGHGVPGAFMSLLGITFLNEIVERDQVVSPDKILNTLRENVIKHLKQRRIESGSKDGMDMAICTLDTKSKKLSFAGANNPLYLVNKKEVKEIKGNRMPVAIHAKMNRFTHHDIPVMPGDSFYIFSDGYADQFGGPEGKKFKYKRLRELLFRIRDKTMDEQREILLKTHMEWKAEYEQVDDIVIIGFRI